jgi:hypothetical protein
MSVITKAETCRHWLADGIMRAWTGRDGHARLIRESVHGSTRE